MKEHNIKINPSKCIGCGLCQKDCPAGNIHLSNKKAVIKNQSCIKCGHCVAICPKAAVTISGYSEPPTELDTQTTLDPSKLLLSLKSRRSIRQFTSQKISKDILEEMIQTGRFTPTAKNANSVSYLVLQKEISQMESMAVQFFKKILPIAKHLYPAAKGITIDQHFFFKGASTAIVILSKDKVSASLAASNMALMAESHGLGVLYSGFFSMAANMSGSLGKKLGVKGKNKVVTTLVLGYPSVRYCRTTQKEDARVEWK